MANAAMTLNDEREGRLKAVSAQNPAVTLSDQDGGEPMPLVPNPCTGDEAASARSSG